MASGAQPPQTVLSAAAPTTAAGDGCARTVRSGRRSRPGAQVLTSAEDVPPGVESMRARAFVAEISSGDVSLPRLTAAQAIAGDGALALATAGYVQWLARR